jgi:hypothetical protein
MIGTSPVHTFAVTVDWVELWLRWRSLFVVFLIVCVVAAIRLAGDRRLRAARKGVAR